MKHSDLPKPLNRRARIEPLSVLPVFLDLHGRCVIVVGNSEGALWKAELALRAGARLRLIAETPSAAMLQLVTDAGGSAELLVSHWRDVSFQNAFLVIADVSEADAPGLVVKAQAARAWVNVVDKLDHCQFQFGSIVNRSPLVIGVSTSGTAPVLAQFVRGQIEAVLPENIRRLALRAAKIRLRVNQRLSNPGLRRDYWRAFFGGAFGSRPKSNAMGRSCHLIKVRCVEDLTIRDIRELQSADQLYVESNADPEILQFGRREARRTVVAAGQGLGEGMAVSGRTVIIQPA